jgi:hypothetical protein
MEDILIGTTDRTILVFIPDPASTTGAGKTGLNAAALTVTYTRVETDNDVVHTDVTSSLTDLSALTDAHSDWGLKEVSSTLSKGLYRLDIADAVFASGAWYAVVQVTITSGTAAATPKAFRLVARNDLDGVRLGLTALPNAAADAAGGLPISDAGGLDLDAKLAATNEVTAARMGALTDWIDGGRLDLLLDAVKAKTDQFAFGTANRVNAQVYGLEAAVITAAAIAASAFTEAKFAAGALTATVSADSFDQSIADALLDRTDGIESGVTLRQALRIIGAAAAGVLSGAATTNVVIKNMGGSTTRIDATVDADGNRSAVTLSA